MKRNFGFFKFCFILLLAYLLWTAVSIVQYGKRDETRSCDAVIVLGAGTFSGEISPVYRERINHGIALWEQGYGDYIILTGGYGQGSSMADSAAAKAYALTRGVPEQVILIEERSTITEENFLYAKEIMDERGLETALVVSDPLHMKRAMLMAADNGIEAYASPTSTTMYRSLKTKLPFLIREEFFYIGYSIIRLFR